jgi:SAM-dependent methyltransferase
MKYDKTYFDWQKDIVFFGGVINRFKFEKYLDKKDVLVDFGSGGGYLLENLDCKEKIGVEINDTARNSASKRGVKSVKSIRDIKNGYADIIISNHVLEHVDCPLEILKELKTKLKKNGKVVFVVPHQGPKEKYVENDINQHLYTWNPLTLGNLFKKAGFKVLEVNTIRHKWPPHFEKLFSLFGKRLFHAICVMYALKKRNYQIRIIAKK